MDSTRTPRRIPGLRLYILLALFILPVVASWFLYEYKDLFHLDTTNHGRLLDPLVHDPAFLTTQANDPAKTPTRPTWQIVYAPEDCQSKTAQTTMFTLHQLHTALGQNGERVRLALLSEHNCQLADKHGFRSLVLDTAALSAVVPDHRVAAKVFLVDPLGNAFMYYHEQDSAMNILKDLKHVLEVSQIG